MGFTSMENPDITATGGSSGYPIKLGDELRYQDLMERVSNIETSVADIKSMMQQMLETSKSQSSAPSTVELWEHLYPLLQTQREHVDLQHEKHMQMFRNLVDATYKETLA
ncbi:hypothetical protein Hanom_Chr14g01260691 [Helianthus anomalus]